LKGACATCSVDVDAVACLALSEQLYVIRKEKIKAEREIYTLPPQLFPTFVICRVSVSLPIPFGWHWEWQLASLPIATQPK
jgi:hypothetical protein